MVTTVHIRQHITVKVQYDVLQFTVLVLQTPFDYKHHMCTSEFTAVSDLDLLQTLSQVCVEQRCMSSHYLHQENLVFTTGGFVEVPTIARSFCVS